MSPPYTVHVFCRALYAGSGRCDNASVDGDHATKYGSHPPTHTSDAQLSPRPVFSMPRRRQPCKQSAVIWASRLRGSSVILAHALASVPPFGALPMSPPTYTVLSWNPPCAALLCAVRHSASRTKISALVDGDSWSAVASALALCLQNGCVLHVGHRQSRIRLSADVGGQRTYTRVISAFHAAPR